MDGDDDDDDDGREEEYYPIDDTLSLLVFPFPPSLTIMLYGRLRVERGVRDEDADKVLDYYHSCDEECTTQLHVRSFKWLYFTLCKCRERAVRVS